MIAHASSQSEVTFVDQQAHQLGNTDRRVGVVELQRKSLREITHGSIGQVVHDVQDMLQRARHEEVLLQ